jgi:hypothetical protein
MSHSIAVDHLLIAAPDLELGRDYAESLFGVRPQTGGIHPGQGTRNALLGLENDVYIEIIAPDPEQPADLPLSRYLAGRSRAALAWWCARCDDLEALDASLREAGIEAGSIDRWSRRTPAGGELGWRLMMPDAPMLGAALPFFIDWDDMAQHPSRQAPSIGRLLSLEIVHPEADRLATIVESSVRVTRGNTASMAAEIDTGDRQVAIRTPDTLPPAIGRIVAQR